VLLQSWPTLHPVLMLVIGAVVSAILTFLAARHWRRHDDAKAAHAAELATAARTATETQEWQEWQQWRKRVEEQISLFVPEGEIADKYKQLGGEIADNQGKIKAYHDAAESNFNALHGRVITLEQHSASLLQVPGQVQRLNTDHAVLAAEVRALTSNLKDLRDEQGQHFKELMHAVNNLSYTRGQMSRPRPTESE